MPEPAVLEGMVWCAGCGEPLHHVPAPFPGYRCPAGCRPPVPADDLEGQVARAVLARMWTPGTLARMAEAQRLLDGLGYRSRNRVPVSLEDAVHQWEHAYDRALRRALVQEVLAFALRLVVARPDSGEDLCFAWRRPSGDPAARASEAEW
ncbi:zinc ribbon domain-containing protein [Streptomyces sp. NPDC048304]|uniref:zinc ribbon domain-containing protein n=1 Tax=Streptomyces sp. NPDC048304 TaxID=3154820 RepID=UPI0033FC3BBA